MVKSKIIEIFNLAKTKQEFLDAVGIPYLHRSGTAVDNDILNIFDDILNITKSDITAKAFRQRYNEKIELEYLKHPNLCQNCGKVIPFKRKDNKCCCTSCSRTIANKNRGKRSDETKRKISEGVKRSLNNGKYTPKNQYTKYNKCKHITPLVKIKNKHKLNNNYKLISECITLGILENYNNVDYVDRLIYVASCKEHICPICGKIYHTYIANNGDLTNYSACSKECLKIKSSNKIKEKIEERKANGTFKGWQSRNIISYPENFWMKVLDNNNIIYKHNYPFNKYFLDFYIENNGRKIDLEIDGKQHKYIDRYESDKLRDKLIKENNIEVYRIDWNEINSDEGKILMKTKIDNFIKFYNN